MTRNEDSDDLWLQTSAKRLKVQISHSDMGCSVFYYKTCCDRFFYFCKKILKENPLLNEEVSIQYAGKEFLVLVKRKTVI